MDWPPLGLLLYRLAPVFVLMTLVFLAAELGPIPVAPRDHLLLATLAGYGAMVLGLVLSSRHVYLARRAAAKEALAAHVGIHEPSAFATVLYRDRLVQVRFWKHGGLLATSDDALAILGASGERILVPFSDVTRARFTRDISWFPLASLSISATEARSGSRSSRRRRSPGTGASSASFTRG